MTPFVSVFSRMIVDLNEDYKKFKIDYKKNIKTIVNIQKFEKHRQFFLIKNLISNYEAELIIYKENLNEILNTIK
jgi:hypothetical protein